MPELPDLTIYREHLARRIVGRRLLGIKVAHPFLLRSVEPNPRKLEGESVDAVSLVGKRIVVRLGELYLIIHLMIAGRLLWHEEPRPVPKKRGLARFDFESGSLLLTEAGSRRRASLTLVKGVTQLAQIDPGGIDAIGATEAEFKSALTRENHTVKRCLTDPRTFAGIGNAYSDEFLHRAGISPFKQSARFDDSEVAALRLSCRDVLTEWIEPLRDESGEEFPRKVTAFRPEMAVHGKYQAPCPNCGTAIQRIHYAENECNYCPGCQTDGKLLADRSLSRLLKNDWPRTVEELEELRAVAPESKS